MSHLKAETSSVGAYLRQLRTPCLVTVAGATLFYMGMMWAWALYAFVFVALAYALAVGCLWAQATPVSSNGRLMLLIMAAVATQIIFAVAGKYVVSFIWNENTVGIVGIVLGCSAGPIGTWIGPVLLNVVSLQARSSHAC